MVFLFSLPQLYWHFPQVPWREVALGLFLLASFSYELLFGANLPRFAFGLMAFLYLPWSLGYVLLLRETPDAAMGLWTLTLPLVASFATDIGAYFIGRAFGRRKLAPEISPGKTVEGSLGGIAVSFLALVVYTGLVREVFPFGLLELWLFSLLLSLGAQLGDLAESMLKRFAGVKDSGNFLPGHGGLLDRIDSLLFAFPSRTSWWCSSHEAGRRPRIHGFHRPAGPRGLPPEGLRGGGPRRREKPRALSRQIALWKPRLVAAEESLHKELKARFPGLRLATAEEVAALEAEVAVAAIPGLAGLAPTRAAVRTGKRVALANKEAMVAAGPLCGGRRKPTGPRSSPWTRSTPPSSKPSSGRGGRTWPSSSSRRAGGLSSGSLRTSPR